MDTPSCYYPRGSHPNEVSLTKGLQEYGRVMGQMPSFDQPQNENERYMVESFEMNMSGLKMTINQRQPGFWEGLVNNGAVRAFVNIAAYSSQKMYIRPWAILILYQMNQRVLHGANTTVNKDAYVAQIMSPDVKNALIAIVSDRTAQSGVRSYVSMEQIQIASLMIQIVGNTTRQPLPGTIAWNNPTWLAKGRDELQQWILADGANGGFLLPALRCLRFRHDSSVLKKDTVIRATCEIIHPSSRMGNNEKESKKFAPRWLSFHIDLVFCFLVNLFNRTGMPLGPDFKRKMLDHDLGIQLVGYCVDVLGEDVDDRMTPFSVAAPSLDYKLAALQILAYLARPPLLASANLVSCATMLRMISPGNKHQKIRWTSKKNVSKPKVGVIKNGLHGNYLVILCVTMLEYLMKVSTYKGDDGDIEGIGQIYEEQHDYLPEVNQDFSKFFMTTMTTLLPNLNYELCNLLSILIQDDPSACFDFQEQTTDKEIVLGESIKSRAITVLERVFHYLTLHEGVEREDALNPEQQEKFSQHITKDKTFPCAMLIHCEGLPRSLLGAKAFIKCDADGRPANSHCLVELNHIDGPECLLGIATMTDCLVCPLQVSKNQIAALQLGCKNIIDCVIIALTCLKDQIVISKPNLDGIYSVDSLVSITRRSTRYLGAQAAEAILQSGADGQPFDAKLFNNANIILAPGASPEHRLDVCRHLRAESFRRMAVKMSFCCNQPGFSVGDGLVPVASFFRQPSFGVEIASIGLRLLEATVKICGQSSISIRAGLYAARALCLMELFPPWTVEARKDAQKALSLDLSSSIDTSIVQKVLMIANIGTKCSVCHQDKNIIRNRCSRCKVR